MCRVSPACGVDSWAYGHGRSGQGGRYVVVPRIGARSCAGCNLQGVAQLGEGGGLQRLGEDVSQHRRGGNPFDCDGD